MEPPKSTTPKPPSRSRTLWVNGILSGLLSVLLAGLLAFQETPIEELPAWVWPAVSIAIAMINMALRFMTTEPIR